MPNAFIELLVTACILSLAWVVFWLAGMAIYPRLFGPELNSVWTPLQRRLFGLFSGAAANLVLVWETLSQQRELGRWFPNNTGLHAFLVMPTPSGVSGLIYGIGMLVLGTGVVLAIALAAKLFGKWALGKLSESERAPGLAGVKAWLSLGNVACVVVIAASAWLALSPKAAVLLLALMLACLLVYPLMTTLTSPAALAGSTIAGDLTPDRQRVLRLLEEGKINASECSELLGAMAQTMPTAMTIQPMTGPRRALVAGAIIVLVAFFLPWFAINPARETATTFDQPSISATGNITTSGDITMSGGDMQHGLGWLMLAMAAMVPAMPYVVPTLPASTRRAAMFLALAAGSVMGLYMLTRGWRWAEYGLCLALAGFAVQWIAAIRESRA